MDSYPVRTILWACCCVFILGCAQDNGGPATTSSHKPIQEDALKEASERLHRARSPDECRAALEVVERRLEADPEGKRQVQDGVKARLALRNWLGLEADEVEEISGSSFRPLDAHHVYQCLELHDVAEALNLQGLPALRQAEEAFAWVVRQVALRSEKEGVLLPPEAILQPGEGSAHERALVFCALLQQLDLDGCMIVLPGRELDKYWIPGVLISDRDKEEIYLFDTRLGVPVPGPGGKGIATLRQVKAEPKLLTQLTAGREMPYDVTPQQAAKAEVCLVLPLTALAPRMKYLEDMLAHDNRLRLALDPAELKQRFEKAAGVKVGTWNEPASSGQPPPWTATRALRLFLPPQQGGLDKSQQWITELTLRQLADAVVMAKYRDLMPFDNLPPPAQRRLREMATRLFFKYVLQPREHLVRGRLEDATRPLTQLRGILSEVLPRAADKLNGLDEWSKQLFTVYLQRHEAIKRGQAAKGEKLVQDFWAQDKYLLALMDLSSQEEQLPRLPRGLTTFLVLAAAGQPLEDDTGFLLTLCKYEEAARQRPKDAGAWENVAGLAAEYAGEHPLTKDWLSRQVKRVMKHWNNKARNPAIALGLWEDLFRQLRRSATAQLIKAQALANSGQRTAAQDTLRRLAGDLAKLRQDDQLRGRLKECLEKLAEFPQGQQELVRPRLQCLQHELETAGALGWLEHRARWELDQLGSSFDAKR
jgi:hypothetical protein